jgi:glycosyltransferase involved in cell wall biosynthesis
MNETRILAGKRILFVFCSFELGGAERQGLHLARYLKGLGCDVRVWSNHVGSGLVIDHCEDAGIPWAIRRFRWPCRKSSLIRDSLKLILALNQERPDVILPYTTWPNVGCGLTWRFSPTKVCIWGQRNINNLNGDAIERIAYRQVSAVICNAEHQIDYLKQTLGDTRGSVFVVHNGVKLDPCIKTRTEWRSELGFAANATVVTMIANFRPQKDHTTLLHAWRKMLDTLPQEVSRPELILVGLPLESYKPVHQLALNLGLHDKVCFLGQVIDISGLLAASDIGVLVSKYEGLSNAVIEYMASSLPVVATDLPGNREALGTKSENQFCKAQDPENLILKLTELLQDPSLRKRLGKMNAKRAAKFFSIDAMCEKSFKIIGNLLDCKTS